MAVRWGDRGGVGKDAAHARVYRTLIFISAIALAAASLAGTGSPAAAGPPVTGGADADLAVTTVGDAQGFHVLVGSGSTGYAWHTAATLAEPGYDTDEWIGQVCVTGSGRRAVAVYAPRQFASREVEFNAGAFVAVLDLTTGAVRKLPVRASLAYYNPGCGPDERVAVSTLQTDGDPVTSMVSIVDAATATVTSTSRSAGQLSSAVPFGGGLAAALGSRLVSVDRSGAVHTPDSLSAAPFRLHPDAAGGVAFEVPRHAKSGDRVEVHRYAGGRAALLGTGRLDSVRLAGVAGRVFVSGADAGQIKLPSSAGWRNVGGSVDGQPSITGALVVTNIGSQNAPTAAAAAAGQLHTPGRPDPVHIQAIRTADHTRLDWQVTPGGASPAGRDSSPALTSPGPHAGGPGAAPGQMRPNVDGSAVPWDGRLTYRRPADTTSSRTYPVMERWSTLPISSSFPPARLGPISVR